MFQLRRNPNKLWFTRIENIGDAVPDVVEKPPRDQKKANLNHHHKPNLPQSQSGRLDGTDKKETMKNLFFDLMGFFGIGTATIVPLMENITKVGQFLAVILGCTLAVLSIIHKRKEIKHFNQINNEKNKKKY